MERKKQRVYRADKVKIMTQNLQELPELQVARIDKHHRFAL